MTAVRRSDLVNQMDILNLLQRAGFSVEETVEVSSSQYGVTGYTVTLQRNNARINERDCGKVSGSAVEVKRLLARLAGPEAEEVRS